MHETLFRCVHAEVRSYERYMNDTTDLQEAFILTHYSELLTTSRPIQNITYSQMSIGGYGNLFSWFNVKPNPIRMHLGLQDFRNRNGKTIVHFDQHFLVERAQRCTKEECWIKYIYLLPFERRSRVGYYFLRFYGRFNIFIARSFWSFILTWWLRPFETLLCYSRRPVVWACLYCLPIDLNQNQ